MEQAASSEVSVLSLQQKILPRSARRSAGHAGVVLGEDSFALVVVRRDGGGKPSIDHCRVHPAHGAVGGRLRAVLEKLGARRAAPVQSSMRMTKVENAA